MENPLNPELKERKRHSCLMALLIYLGLSAAIGSIFNLLGRNQVIRIIPDLPPWAPTGILAIGLLGTLTLGALIAIWYWKRWGVYAYGSIMIIALALNTLLLGIERSWFGLIGPSLLFVFILRQWSDYD